MSLLSTFGHIAARQADRLTGVAPPPKFRSPAPLGLYQLSAVEFDDTLHILQEVQGGALPEFGLQQTVAAVGRLSLQGIERCYSYLSGGQAFVETIPSTTDRMLSTQTRLWVQELEFVPSTAEEWAGILDQGGVLGWNGFQLDAKGSRPALVYGREWSRGGAEWIPPVTGTESVADTNGNVTVNEHRVMLYSRAIGPGAEYLMADVIQSQGGQASMRVYLGTDITASQMTVYPSATVA